MPDSDIPMLLFIHKSSEPCKKLIKLIPKDINMNVIDIEINPGIPKEITSVPAIIIDNKKLLLGKECFDLFTKENDLECVSFCTKGSSMCCYSDIDSDVLKSNQSFSIIDEKPMNDGVKEWKEENDSNLRTLESLEKQRQSEIPVLPRKE